MNADDKSKLKAYEELIGSLEHTNGLQHRVIETQSSLIKSLEEHNAEEFFGKLGDLLDTGPPRTNINDYRVILIP